jgi:hypothetical protein
MVSGRFLSSDWAKKHAFLWETSGGGAGFARGAPPSHMDLLLCWKKNSANFWKSAHGPLHPKLRRWVKFDCPT